jgi:hypothetical protein
MAQGYAQQFYYCCLTFRLYYWLVIQLKAKLSSHEKEICWYTHVTERDVNVLKIFYHKILKLIRYREMKDNTYFIFWYSIILRDSSLVWFGLSRTALGPPSLLSN